MTRTKSQLSRTKSSEEHSETSTNHILTVNDLNQAELLLIRLSQSASFSEEIKALMTSSALPKKSRLKQLVPFLDEDGILRVEGRIDEAPISYDAKHPIILDGRTESKITFPLILLCSV